MALSVELISQFVKATKDTETKKTETIVYGTVVQKVEATDERNETVFVQFDGSTLSTPVITTAATKNGDRVTVMIKNHTAVITGNITDPSASTKTVGNIESVTGETATAVTNLKTDLRGMNSALKEIIGESAADTITTNFETFLTDLKTRNDEEAAKVNDIKKVVDMIIAVAEEHDMDVAAIMNNIMTVIKGLDDRFTTQYQDLAGYVQDQDHELYTRILGEVGEYVDAIHIRINDSLDRINSLETRVFKLENT